MHPSWRRWRRSASFRQPFDIFKLDPAVRAALKDLPKTTLAKIVAQATGENKLVNGWKIGGIMTGYYGTNYFARALIAAIGWPANLPEDAVYPRHSWMARATGLMARTNTPSLSEKPDPARGWLLVHHDVFR